jgi:Tfp pilus assembly protein PilF
MELAPGNATAYNGLAWFYVTGPTNSRSPGKALPLALKAVELDKSNYAALNTLGVVYYRLGQFSNAITTLETGIKADSAGGSAHDFFFLAMAYQRLGNSTKAEDYFAKALKWWQDHASAADGDAELLAFRAEAEQLLGKAKPR